MPLEAPVPTGGSFDPEDGYATTTFNANLDGVIRDAQGAFTARDAGLIYPCIGSVTYPAPNQARFYIGVPVVDPGPNAIIYDASPIALLGANGSQVHPYTWLLT